MAPMKKATFAVPKTMTLPLAKVSKSTAAKKMPSKTVASKKKPPAKKAPPNKKARNAKRPDTQQLELSQSSRVAKKPFRRQPAQKSEKTSALWCNSLLVNPSTLTSEQRAVVERHEEELAEQKKDLARWKKAEAKRAKVIRTKGYLYKGRWVPLTHRPAFTIKIEHDDEGEQLPESSQGTVKVEENEDDSAPAAATMPVAGRAGVDSVTLQSLLAATPRTQGRSIEHRARRAGGPDITKSFDKQYPLIAERFENQMLDEQDEAGSLCDFVTADEWTDGDQIL